MKAKLFNLKLSSFLALVLALLCPASVHAAVEIFSSAVTNFNWVCPPGVTSVQVECWGGGGAGGGAFINGGTANAGGGGGGGGAYARLDSVPVTPGVNYTVTIPAGAACPASGFTNLQRYNGSAVTFTGDGGTNVTANGGTGGQCAIVTGATAFSGAIGVGGATNTGLSAAFAGGSSVFWSSGNGAGGGGGAGSTGAGGSPSAANATFGAGGTGSDANHTGGNGGASKNGAGIGNDGASPGAGGGGAKATVASPTSKDGGAAGRGRIILTYIVPVKADNLDDLNLATSWVGSVPTSAESGRWDNTVTGPNTTVLGADTTWAAIHIANPAGLVTINPGNTLTIGAAATDINMASATTNLTLNCNLALGAANVWDVTTSRTLTVGGVVSGANDILKQGAGTAILTNANTYTGTTTISNGVVKLQNASALGTTAGGTFVNGTTAGTAANARLDLEGNITVTGEALTLQGNGDFYGALNSRSGSNTWAGPVTIDLPGTRIGAAVAGSVLVIDGVINSGANAYGVFFRSFDATATVILKGANTYLGDTTNAVGKLQLAGGNNRLPVASKLVSGSAALVAEFDLNGVNQEVAGLAVLAGATAALNSITNSSGTPSVLTVNTVGSPSTWAGIIAGNLALTKTGADTLTLSGTNTYTGDTAIQAGTLNVRTANSGGGGFNLSSGATLAVTLGSAETTLVMSGYTVGTGCTNTFNYGTFGYSTNNPAINITGDLTMNGDVLVNVTGSGFVTGTTNLLLQYTSRSGSGSFVLGSTPVTGQAFTLVDDTVNKQVRLEVSAPVDTIWTGAASGSWANVANWNSTLPTVADTVIYTNNGALNLNQTLNAAQSAYKIIFKDLPSPVTISGGGAFALSSGSGIDMSAAGANLTVLADYVPLSATHSLKVAAGRTLTLSNVLANIISVGNISGPGTVRIVGTAGTMRELTNSATLLIDGGTVANNGSPLTMGAAAGDTVSTIITNGGSLRQNTSSGSSINLGFNNAGTNVLTLESGSIYVTNSGSSTANQIVLGNTAGSTAIMNVKGGTVTLVPKTLTDGVTGETTLRVGNASGVTGILNLNGGTLNVPYLTATASATSTVNFNGTTVVGNKDNTTWITGLTTANVQVGGAIFTNAGFSQTIPQSLLHDAALGATPDGGLTKSGTGVLTLSGTNTYTGTTLVSSGPVLIGHSNALGATVGGTVVSSGATLGLSAGSFTISEALSLSGVGGVGPIATNGALYVGGSRTLTWDGPVTLTGNTKIHADGGSAFTFTANAPMNLGANELTFDAGNGANSTFAGDISGVGGSLTKTLGTTVVMTLSGSNTFSGPTTISAGILSLADINALLNTSGITMATGTTLRSTTSSVVVVAPITTAGTVTINAPNNNAGQVFSELILNGAIGGSANVTFSSILAANTIQTVTLGVPGTYSGTTLVDNDSGSTASQIIVKLGAHNALPPTTVVTIDGRNGTGTGRAAEINLFGFNQTLAGLTNVTRSLRTQRVVNSDVAAAATLTISNSTDYTYSGLLGGVANFSVSTNAMPGSTSGNNFGLTKAGSAKFTLTGTNTYTGNTTVGNGTLLVNNIGGSGTGTGAVTVNDGGTLGGTGSIAGVVTNNPGGTLSPGTSIGTLTLNSNLVLSAGSTNTFEVDGTTPPYDTVDLGAAVTYGGVLKIVPTGTFTNAQTFTLFSGAGATTAGNFASIAGSPGAGLAFSFTNGVLTVVSVGPMYPPATLLTNSFSGGTLSLSWPGGQGWKLQQQTNAASKGLFTNWVDVTDSSVNSTNITVDKTRPTVFYRLVYP